VGGTGGALALEAARRYEAEASGARELGAAVAYAKRGLLDMWRHAEGGGLVGFELAVMVDLGSLGTPGIPGPGIPAQVTGPGTRGGGGPQQPSFRRRLHEAAVPEARFDGGSSPGPSAAQGQALAQPPVLGAGFFAADALGFDPSSVYRSLGRVSPLTGFDVLCASPPPDDDAAAAGNGGYGGGALADPDVRDPFAPDDGGWGSAAARRRERRANDPCAVSAFDLDALPAAATASAGGGGAGGAQSLGGVPELRTRPVAVASCFNGLALYNPAALQLCDFAPPSSAAGGSATPRGATRGFDDDGSGAAPGGASPGKGPGAACESPDAAFGACLAGSGFGRVFLDPLLTVHRTATMGRLGRVARPLDRKCVQLDDPTGAALPPSF